jgi:NADPH-dependent 2,4-dienoyl-CoA reductase/sulfur reductase-like enzyme
MIGDASVGGRRPRAIMNDYLRSVQTSEMGEDNGERDEKDVVVESRYQDGADRMVRRWAGVPGAKHPPRSEGNAQVMSREGSGAGQSFSSAPSAPLSISETRQTPVHATCDVLVVGAGPAGLSAALGARRAGADVMILERFGCFGGVITTCGMETLAWYRYEGTQDCEGIGTEMERVAAQMGGTIKWPYNGSECLDADFFKIVADKLIQARPSLAAYI